MGKVFNSILFDKSAFESFNIDEIFFISQYYQSVVCHILIIEILADLKKKGGNRDPKERVKQLSHKILQLQPRYIVNYHDLIQSELFGNKIEMDSRPILGKGRNVSDMNGKKGVVFEQQFEEKMLHRWRDGEFEKAEELAAAQYRFSIEDIKIDLQDYVVPEKIRSLKNFDDIIAYTDHYLENVEVQKQILTNILTLYRIESKLACEVLYKIESNQIRLISEYAPYTYFCYRVYLIFSLALAKGMITPRKTDIIDLQYFYYLPFAAIFSSEDKFHRLLYQYFIRPDQTFIQGSKIKNDMGMIVQLAHEQKELSHEDWIIRHKSYPPKIDGSFTAELWDKYVPNERRRFYNNTPREATGKDKELIERIKKLASLPEDKTIEPKSNADDKDYIIVQRWVGPEDFCPCKSGKLFKDCCLSKVKKNT